MRNVLISIVVSLACHPLVGQVALFRKDAPVGDRPLAVVVGDFNGDSRPDLAINTFSGLSVLLNSGASSFARSITIPAEIHPQFGPTPTNYTLAADFNRDGRLDLAGAVDAIDPPLRRVVRLLFGRGDGTFLTRDIETGQVMVLGTGDFNGDHIPDLVIEESGSLLIRLGDGEGNFQRGARIEGAVSGARVADFNRDGLSDLAANLPQGGLAVWLNKGDGTFRPPVETSDAGVGIVADFNRDGVTDMATGTEVLLGKGDGTFQAIRYVPSRRGFPIPFAAADFDGDGQVDLAGWLSNEGGEGNYLTLFRGRGDGSLSLPTDYVAGWQATGQGAADLDGDGRPDLIVSNFRSNSVTLLMPRASAGPSLNRVVSAASGTAIVAPDSLATLFATTGATATQSAATPFPMRLGGISLDIRDSAGVTRPAPLVFVSPAQINFQVPAGTAVGEATLVINGDRGSSPVGGMQVEVVAPALFMVSYPNSTPAALGVRVAADGRQTPVPVFNCFGSVPTAFSCGPAPIRPAGDPVYLSFYATGFRGANAGNVTCSVNGVGLPVEYAGPQGTAGIDQINVRLPPEAALGPPGFVTCAIDGVVANTALLSIVR